MSTKDHFHINGYALSLSFKQKFWATRKWPTVYSNTNELVDCKQSLLWSEGNRAGNEGGSLSFSRFQSRAWSFSCLLRFARRTKKKTETALSLTSQPLFELSSSKWERERQRKLTTFCSWTSTSVFKFSVFWTTYTYRLRNV